MVSLLTIMQNIIEKQEKGEQLKGVKIQENFGGNPKKNEK